MKIAAILAVAGLAGIASAQISIVNNLPGSFTNIAGAAGATFIASGDDSGHNIMTTVGNVAFPAGNVRISNNGNAHAFGAVNPLGGTGWTNAAIPAGPGHAAAFNALAVGVMMPWWEDLFPAAGGASGIWWQETGNTLTIQWHDQDAFGAVGTGTVRFQMKLFNTGSNGATLAQFIYDDAEFAVGSTQNNGGSGTIGYSTASPAGAGLNNAQWSFNTPSIQTGSVLTIIPAPGALALLGLGGLVAGRRNRR